MYRTLYCAEDALTCLREVLADLRPNAKAIAELRAVFGAAASGALQGVGVVGVEWQETHVLCPAMVVSDREMCDLDRDVELRHELEREHSSLLAAHNMDHLDISQIRSRDRIVTQTISRVLFERDYGGVRFGSNLDNQPCYALFEGKAELIARGDAIDLAPDCEPLRRVCRGFDLTLAQGSSCPRAAPKGVFARDWSRLASSSVAYFSVGSAKGDVAALEASRSPGWGAATHRPSSCPMLRPSSRRVSSIVRRAASHTRRASAS